MTTGEAEAWMRGAEAMREALLVEAWRRWVGGGWPLWGASTDYMHLIETLPLPETRARPTETK